MSEMNVAPACSPLDVQVPRGMNWKMPFLPLLESQLAIEPSPAPMSDEITARWRLGSPCGLFFSAVTKVAKLRFRLSCDSRIDDESSIRNRMSTLRFAITTPVPPLPPRPPTLPVPPRPAAPPLLPPLPPRPEDPPLPPPPPLPPLPPA